MQRIHTPMTSDHGFSYFRILYILGPLVVISFGIYSSFYGGGFNVVVFETSTVARVETASVGANFRCISDTDFQIMQAAVSTAKNAIWRYWDVGNYPLFLSTFHVPKKSWDIQMYKFVKLLLEDVPNKQFVAGFSGSSVTAGHGKTIMTFLCFMVDQVTPSLARSYQSSLELLY
jgi:hypothetical protein